MPGLDGIAAAGLILRRNPAARIVFVTVHNGPETLEKGLATRAMGYVLNLTEGDDLLPAIRAVLQGKRHHVMKCRTRTYGMPFAGFKDREQAHGGLLDRPVTRERLIIHA